MSDTQQPYQQQGIKYRKHQQRIARNKPLTNVRPNIFEDSKKQKYGLLPNGQIVKLRE